RFQSLGLSAYDAGVLTADKSIADYFDEAVAAGAPPKSAANWISSEVLSKRTDETWGVDARALAELIGLIEDKTISGKIAKEVFDKMWASGRGARAIVEAEGLTQVTDAGALEAACRAAVEANPKQVEQFKKGNAKLLGFFVGQVMKATQGKANPEMVNEILTKLLS